MSITDPTEGELQSNIKNQVRKTKNEPPKPKKRKEKYPAHFWDEIVENSDAGKARTKSFRNLSESTGTDIKHKDQAMRLLGMGIQMTQQDIMNSFRKRNEENGSETKSKLELHESFQVCILFFLCHNISYS